MQNNILNDLLLLSGNDIPFISAQTVIHQPTIKEIGLIGEQQFFTACELLSFSKENLEEKDKIGLEDTSNFDILIAILGEQNAVMQKNRNCVEMLLTLLFPECHVKIDCVKKEIRLTKKEEIHFINENSFSEFQSIIETMFNYRDDKKETFNPSGDLAKRIADKLKRRHQRLNQEKGDDKSKKIDLLSRYVSILTIGERKDLRSLLNLTVYQLFDEFKRFELKEQYNLYEKAKLAGAQDLKEIEDWMQDIHS